MIEERNKILLQEARDNYLAATRGQNVSDPDAPDGLNAAYAEYLHQRLLVAALAYAQALEKVMGEDRLQALIELVEG